MITWTNHQRRFGRINLRAISQEMLRNLINLHMCSGLALLKWQHHFQGDNELNIYALAFMKCHHIISFVYFFSLPLLYYLKNRTIQSKPHRIGLSEKSDHPSKPRRIGWMVWFFRLLLCQCDLSGFSLYQAHTLHICCDIPESCLYWPNANSIGTVPVQFWYVTADYLLVLLFGF